MGEGQGALGVFLLEASQKGLGEGLTQGVPVVPAGLATRSHHPRPGGAPSPATHVPGSEVTFTDEQLDTLTSLQTPGQEGGLTKQPPRGHATGRPHW